MTIPRAAIYIRVSTGAQEDGSSLESQEAACRAYATENGYEIDETHVYVEVHTGAELWERPRLTKLREAIRHRVVDVLVAYALDRLSRDQRHVAVILAEAENAGASVEFVTERLEDTAEGRLLLSIKGYLAEAERMKIRERTSRGRRSRVESGRPLAGPRAIYGCRWLPDQMVPGRARPIPKPGLELDPITAPIVRRIFVDALAGKSQHAITHALNAEGVPTPSGNGLGRWHQSTIRHILTNPAYAGRAAGLRVAVLKERGKKLHRQRPEAEHIPLPEGTVPPLVELAAFDQLQGRFKLNKERATRNNRAPEATLLRGGYVRCGACGSAMFVHRTGKYRNYRCGGTMRIAQRCAGAMIAVELADTWAWARVEAILTKPETIAEELLRLRMDDPTEKDLAFVDRQHGTVERQQRNLVANLGMLDPESAEIVRKQLAALSARRQELVAERNAIAERRRVWEAAQTRLEDLQAWCRRVADRVQGLSYDERRLTLDALGVQVRVWKSGSPERIDLTAGIPLTPDGGGQSDIAISTSRSADTCCIVTLTWTLGEAA